MDALNMSYPNSTFDLTIDKGTLDALCCGSDYSIPGRLLQEMLRVTKPQGYICLITHSGIEKRGDIFREYLDPKSCRISFKKQNLSDTSNLINIMRSVKKASLREIVQDPEAMRKIMMKCS